jgi:hypothetical protein
MKRATSKQYGDMRKLVLWTLAAFLLALYPIHRLFGLPVLKTVVIGYLLSLTNIITAYISIRWAFGRKSRDFFAVVMGGMAFRLILFTATLFFILRFTSLPLLGFIISFMIFYVFLQFYEIRLVNQELTKTKDRKNAS